MASSGAALTGIAVASAVAAILAGTVPPGLQLFPDAVPPAGVVARLSEAAEPRAMSMHSIGDAFTRRPLLTVL